MMLLHALSALPLVPGLVSNAFTALLDMMGGGSHVSPTVELASGIAAGNHPKDLMDNLGNVAAKTKHPRNYERSLHRWFRRQNLENLMPRAYDFPLTVYCKTKLTLKQNTFVQLAARVVRCALQIP